jgi:hypothetical protein
MIQLDFDAATASRALGIKPALVGFSQHEGAESAHWGDSKLKIVDGTHPVVYPALGSHANYSPPGSIWAEAPPRASAATTRPGLRGRCARGSC